VSEFIKRDIADYVIAALAANHGLDAMRLFIRGGAPMPVPSDLHPYTEVEIGEEQPVGEYTGGVFTQTYIGLITVNTLAEQGDWLEVTGDRIARVKSYDAVEELVHAVIVELQRDMHRSLGNLSSTYIGGGNTVVEVVTQFSLSTSQARIYGLDNRADNFTNFGSIPFEVETQRSLA
jgi:hypothetical protein